MKESFRQKWQRIYADPRTKKAQKWLQRLILLGILGLIIYQLTDIGWGDVLTSLPANPLFYLLFAVLFMTLPVAEVFIYRQLWSFDAWQGLKTFITKWVYNHEIVGYSGEVYLFMWARKRVDESDKQIFKRIRDNSILSSITSNSVAVGLLLALLATGNLDLSHVLEDATPLYAGVVILVLIVVTAVAVQFRKYIFELPLKKAAVIFSIYMSRFLVHHAGLVVMWMAAIPSVPFSVWLTFLALLIVINRIPIVPNKDLVFLWAGIEFARGLDVTIAEVAGMLLVYSALHKVANLVLFLLITYVFKDPESQEAGQAGSS